MPKQKYDFNALKKEYFDSPIDEVKWFLRDKWMSYNSRRATETKGWRKEKQEHKKLIIDDAIRDNAKKQAKELAVPIEKLMEWKKAILWLLLQQVKKYMDDSRNERGEIVKDIDVWNAERILRMFKTELWEPSTIWTNYNLNANKNDILTDEELEALDTLFNNQWKKKKQ